MNAGTFLGLLFIVLFLLGVLIVGGIDLLITRAKKQMRREKELELEIERLKATNKFLLFEMQRKK